MTDIFWQQHWPISYFCIIKGFVLAETVEKSADDSNHQQKASQAATEYLLSIL